MSGSDTGASPDSTDRDPGRHAAWTVDCIRGTSALDSVREEWLALERRVPRPLPFASYDWTAAWWAHLRRRGPAMRDRLAVCTVRDADGALVAVAPMMETSASLLPLLRIRQFVGADPNLTEVRGLLAQPQDRVRAVQALRAYFGGHGAHWTVWAGISPEALTATLPSRAVIEREVPMFVVDLPASWDELRAGLSRNMKEALRKCVALPRRDGIEWRFVAYETAEDIAERLPQFRALHRARSTSAEGVWHRDYFADDRSAAFLHDVVTRRAAHGAARLFGIEVDGRLVAARIGFVAGDQLYLYFSGYEPEYAKYSIATTLVAEVMKWAIGAGLGAVNLSPGRDVSKLRWKPREVLVLDVADVGEGRGSAWRYDLFAAARRLRAARRTRRAQSASRAGGGSPATGSDVPALEDARDNPSTRATPDHALPMSSSSAADAPLVSVVIPTFRRPAELREAIESALAQQGITLEVIVVDDSPEGGAADVVSAIGDARVTYMKCEPPSGGKPSMTRNRGWPRARGRYVHFLDDDDRLLPGATAAMVAALEARPTVAVAIGVVRPFGNDPAALAHETEYFRQGAETIRAIGSSRALAARMLYAKTPLVNSSCLVRRDCVEAIGGYSSAIRYVEDVDFYLRAIRYGGHVFIDQPVVEYRVGTPSLMHSLTDLSVLRSSYRQMYANYRSMFGRFDLVRARLVASLLFLGNI